MNSKPIHKPTFAERAAVFPSPLTGERFHDTPWQANRPLERAERGCPQPQRVTGTKPVRIFQDAGWHSGVLRLETAALRFMGRARVRGGIGVSLPRLLRPIGGALLLIATIPLFAAEHGKHAHATPTGVASLDVFASGNTIHLLVADYAPGADTPTLHHRRFDDADDAWSNPVRVDASGGKGSNPFRPHRGMDPQIAAHGDRVVAAWTTPGTDRFGSGPMALALSADGGKTWRPGPNPADDGLTTGHGFIDLTADAQGQFHLVWLDSRDGKQGVRHARSADGGRHWSKNATVKAQSCECCWNNIVADARGGLHVLFRDQSPRDMALASSTDGGAKWSAPVVVGDFDWEFSGCPHVGGGLAVTDAAGAPVLDAIVWSGAEGKSGVSHLRSTDGGRAWSVPTRLCNGEGRRADLATLDANRLAAAWEVVGEDESFVMSTQSVDGGKTWSPAKRLSATGRTAAYPRVVATKQGFRVFWTESAHGTPVAWRMEKL